MLSFPSTLNTGGANINLPTLPKKSASDILKSMGKSFVNSLANTLNAGITSFWNGTSSSGAKPNMERLPYDMWNKKEAGAQNIFDTKQVGIWPGISTRVQLGSSKSAKSANGFWHQDPLIMSPEVYTLMNTYRYVYSNGVIVPMNGRTFNQAGEEEEYLAGSFDGGALAPSLFNPYYGIQRIGPTRNTPLTDNSDVITKSAAGAEFNTDFTDCSIRTLCKLSAQASGELGQARYKYSDFMYCKDLGMPNNRMITLRKFAQPVGDIIMSKAATDDSFTGATPGDIGRLVGYFDTDDNKLEDILNYGYNATWKEMQSGIKQLDSQEDDRPSPLGMMLNTMSSQYRQSFIDSTSKGNNLFDYFLGKMGLESSTWYANNKTLYNYDELKVYDPIDTTRSMYMYEGNLTFNHEFTLTFNYTLRSYDNINPKAAMLDLLANITAVTYKRGHFWGGRQEIIGPQPNIAGWKKADAIINKGWDQLGGIFESLIEGGFNLSGMLGNLSNYFQNLNGTFTQAIDNAGGTSGVADNAKKAIRQAAGPLGAMAKAKLKDTLGRPQLYAFNSLLTGDNTGLWHVTIGNPRNPIAVMGNMIMTDAKVQHYGPLGIDDFPTGLKVTVTMKHARPRDMVDIQKMYTRGIASIYVNMNNPASLDDKTAADTSPKHYSSEPAGIMYAGEYDHARIARNRDEIM